MSGQPRRISAIVVGAGPAGLGILLAARQNNSIHELLCGGLRILERTAEVGRGEIGNYLIRSDSTADSFLKAVDLQATPSLRPSLTTGSGAWVHAQRGMPVDLPVVADFLSAMAGELRRYLAAAGDDPVVTGVEALSAQRDPDGSWMTQCRTADGSQVAFHSHSLILATGAHQPEQRLHDERVAGSPLMPRYAGKIIQSAEFLGPEGRRRMAALMQSRANPKIAIVGGSHSAIATANTCLLQTVDRPLDDGSITLLHRRRLRLTYASPAEALADGYAEFGPDDICAKTGRVFPLAGFRTDSRELLRCHLELGGRKRDSRLRLLRLEEHDYAEANGILDEADLIVAALGYRPRALPLFDEENTPLKLLADNGVAPLVDAASRVLDADGRPIAGVFALGLAAGYPLAGSHGESSFSGQANGLALWHSEIGAEIVLQILERAHRNAPAAEISAFDAHRNG